MFHTERAGGMRGLWLHLAATGISLLGTLAAHAQQPQKFLFGGDLPTQPSDQIRSLFFESGMNCVRLTGGGYDWSAAMHKKLADDLQQRGLMVYLQLGSHYPSADYFPLKDAYFVDQAGQTGMENRNAWAISYAGQNWPQYSYAHEGFRRKLEGDFIAYLKHFSSNTNVAGVILHNEPGYFWITDRVFDYGAPAVAKFRAYLQQQHGTIEMLNERWGTKFASFADVTPPGKPPVDNIAAWMDWRRYHAAQIAEFVEWEADFFRAQQKEVARTTNLAGPLDHWFGYRCAQNDILSAKMDGAGIDIYPTQWTERVHVPYSMDMTQGVAQGRPAHVLECDVFSPKLWKDYSEDQRADMLRGEIWTMIGHGARTVFLWGFSRNDEFSLTDGEFNARFRTCRDIAHAANAINLDQFSRPRPQVAVCVDPDSYLYATGIEPKPHQLSPAEDAETRGIYAALADSHIPADVILTSQLQAGVWKSYRAIVLASARMMDEQTASQLDQFVADGGTLIADGPLAQLDRWGKRFQSVPGAKLDRVFGIRSTQSQAPQGWFTINSPAGNVSADAVRDQVQLSGAQSIGTLSDGTPGMTSFQHGKGRAILVNGRIGTPYLNGGTPDLHRWMASMLDPVVQTPRIRVTAEDARQIDTSFLRDAKGNLLLVASTLGSKGKPAPTFARVDLSIAIGQPATLWHAYVFAPTREHDGAITSGPQALPISADKAGILALAAGEVTSATPILLAVDLPPLLAISSPSRAARGKEITVTVTCLNPSPRPIGGTATLQVGGQMAGKPVAVSLTPYGQTAIRIALPVAETATVGRTVVNANLNVQGGGKPVTGIPVDVQID